MRKGEIIDWGEGIPNYSIKDLMTKEEVHDFGIEVIGGYLNKKGFEVLNVNNTLNMFPSIIAKKDEQLYAVVVMTDIIPVVPKMYYDNKRKLIDLCKSRNYIPAFASVPIGSVDSERLERSIALHGDGYYTNFAGLEYISMEKPELGSEDYISNCIYDFATGYEEINVNLIKKHLDQACNWYSEFSKSRYNGKEEVLNYYKEKFMTLKNSNTTIYSELVQFKGDYAEIIAKELELPNKIVKNAKVKFPQEDNKIALLIEQELNGETVGLLIDFDFNKNGKIDDIKLLDPYKYKFVTY